METIISSIVEKIVEYSVAPVVRQFGYLIRYKRNVAHLTNQAQQLCNKRDGVNMEVEPARDALMRIDPGVESWLEEVHKIMEEKETRFKEETVATNAICCNGWFPNLKGRYSLGRKAKKMTLVVKELLDRNLGTIVHPAPPPEAEFPPTQDSTQLAINIQEGASSSAGGTSNHTSAGGNIDFKSRRSTIRDVMEALKGKEINPIVICGMGGVGKTTLVGEVVNRAKIEDVFDEYTKADVTETPDLSKIQRDVAEYLGLPLTEQGLKARADKLRKRLSGTKRVLVVLDNVWTTLDLWEIGIPCDPKICTVLVTSRNQDVFNEMEETRKNFPIGVLPESDAWSLFKKKAGGHIEADPELRSIAEQVLSKCDGLPVAISTLGSALRQKKKSFWKDALGVLQKPFRGDIQGMKENVYKAIRLSYDFLEREEAKSCFLLCCVFPGSTDILVEDLVMYGLGLGLFQGIDLLEGGRDRVEALLDTLKSCYLLLDNYKEECIRMHEVGFHNQKKVRMHDVVRAVGLHIASDESGGTFLVRHGVALEGWPHRFTCSSLTANKTSHPELMLLSRTEEVTYCSPYILGTLNGVEDLKVLDISVPFDEFSMLAFTRAPRLTSLPVLLRDIQTLCLKGLELELQTISVIGELRTLMILRLSGSTIMHVPEEFKNLCNLKLLDLAECWRLKKISPGVISSLSKLEELYLWGSFEKWDDAGIIRLSSELLDLPLLTSLETDLAPVFDILPNSVLLFDKLKRFKLAIRERQRKAGRCFEAEENSLILNNDDADSLAAVTVLLKKTEFLKLEMESLAHPLNAECVANLKSLELRKCYDLEYLVDMTHTNSSPVFPVLDSLQISVAESLKEICHGLLPVGSLKQLRLLHIEDAPVLRQVWKIGSHFDHLEILNVRNCKSLEVIVACQESGDDDEEEACQINFPNLTRTNTCPVFTVLDTLQISVAESLKEICRGLLPVGSLTQLRQLHIEDAPVLRQVWKIGSHFDHLEILNVRNCKSLEVIVACQESGDDDDEEACQNNFPNLTTLVLEALPSLVGISSKKVCKLNFPQLLQLHLSRLPEFAVRLLLDPKVDFPVLKTYSVEWCNIKEIWNNQLSPYFFYDLRVLYVDRCDQISHLVPTYMQTRLPKLENIHVSYCSSLQEIFELRRSRVNEYEGSSQKASDISQPDQGIMQINNQIMDFKVFQHLTNLFVSGCNLLTKVCSSSIARSLVNLEYLDIKNCWHLREIVAAEEGEEAEDNMFPRLRTLLLLGLSNLVSFSTEKYALHWPSMELINIGHCGKMKNFSSGSLLTPMEMKIVISHEVDENIQRELDMSRRKSPI